MKKCFFALMLCFQLSFSQDTDHLNVVLKQLKFKESAIDVQHFTEKIMPYDKTKSIMVIPKYASEVTADYFVLDAYILVIDNSNGKILHKFIEPNAWTSDAVMLSNISIDTGLYLLSKTTRAFGVRVSYTGSSRPNPYSETNLSLYIIDKNALKPVLNNYTISKSNGEWDTNCAGEFEDSNSAIDMDKMQTNNYNNIILKTKITNIKNTPTEDDCIAKEIIRRKISKLVFNGKEYK